MIDQDKVPMWVKRTIEKICNLQDNIADDALRAYISDKLSRRLWRAEEAMRRDHDDVDAIWDAYDTSAEEHNIRCMLCSGNNPKLYRVAVLCDYNHSLRQITVKWDNPDDESLGEFSEPISLSTLNTFELMFLATELHHNQMLNYNHI